MEFEWKREVWTSLHRHIFLYIWLLWRQLILHSFFLFLFFLSSSVYLSLKGINFLCLMLSAKKLFQGKELITVSLGHFWPLKNTLMYLAFFSHLQSLWDSELETPYHSLKSIIRLTVRNPHTFLFTVWNLCLSAHLFSFC